MTPRRQLLIIHALGITLALTLLALVISIMGWGVAVAILAIAGTVVLPLLVAGWVRE